MANVVLGVVGAVIGSFTPAGPWVGFAIGSAVGSLLFPSGADQKGPRLNDLKIESSAYGTPIPIVYGSARVGGAIIWATDLVEHEHEEGGKGGPTVTTYTYSASFAVSVCEGPIAGIRRIWSMGTLIYDVSGESEETALPNLQLTIYLGTEDQMPDPTIESYLGAGNVPAYRGQAYVVFTDLDLSNYGNSLAGTQLEFEVVTKAVPASESATLNAWGNTTGFMSRDPVTGYLYAPNGGSVVVYDPATETIVQTIALSPLGLNATAAPYGIVYGNGTMFVGDAEGDWYGHVGWSIDCATNVATVINGQSTNPFQGGLYFSPGVPSTEGVFFNTGLSGGSWDVYRNIDGVPDSPQMAGVALSPDGLTEVFWAVGVPNQLLINLLQPEGGGWQFVFTPINPDWPSSDGFNDGALLAFDDTNRIIYWGNKHQTGVYAVDLGTGAVSQVLSGITPIFLLYSPDTGRLYVQDAANGYFSSYQKSGATFTLLQAYSGATITSTGGQHTTGIYVGGETWAVATSTGGTANTSLWTVRFPEGAILNGLPVLLKDIVSDLSVRTERLTTADIDVTELTDLVDGYVVSRQAPARACIEQLQQAYFFDAVESQDIIRFPKRGQASLVTIPREDLAAHVVGQELPDALSVTRKQEVELPQIIDLNYISQAGDYQTGTQRNRRMATLSGESVSVELPIVMSEDKAKQVVDTLMYNAWTERMACSFQTSRKYAAYEPTDVMTVEATDIRIVKKVESDGIIKWEGVPERAYVYSQFAVGAQLGGIPIQGVPQLQAADWVLLDLPLLRDADDDPGFYLAARGSGSPWPGMALFKSADGGATYTEIERTTTASPMGAATTVLGDFEGGNVFDELNTVTVTLTGGTLSSVSALAVLNGANAAALASGDGWEILQYKRAALNDDGSYTLSGLLRGRKGTEWAMGGHAVGDQFVVLSTALSRIDGTLGEIGLARDFKGVTIGLTLASAQPKEFTAEAIALRCYSPVLLGGGFDAEGNATLQWVRRGRIANEWKDAVDVPLSESSEAYEVEIWNSDFSTLKRTIKSLTSPKALYTDIEQVADFGSKQATIYFRVYQINQVGRGFGAQGTAPASTTTALMAPLAPTPGTVPGPVADPTGYTAQEVADMNSYVRYVSQWISDTPFYTGQKFGKTSITINFGTHYLGPYTRSVEIDGYTLQETLVVDWYQEAATYGPITWSLSNMPFSQWDDIAYSSDLSLFVAIGGIGRVDGGFVVTSTDGVTWTTQSGAAHNNWNRVAWLPPSDANGFVGRFVCGAWGGGTLSPAVFGYSNDGTSWTIPSFSDNISGVTGFAYSPELKLMVASLDHSPGALGDPGVYTTVDGITWTGRTTPPIHFRDVVWSSELGLFAAVGDATSDGTWPQVATSPDGVTWTARSCPIGQWQSVAWSPSLGLFVAVGMDSKGVLYAGDLRGVVLSAEAAIESAIMTSPDGITWTAVMPPPKMDLFSVAWSPTRGIFMATGRCREPGPTIEGFPSGILTSHDGVTWTLQPAPTLTTFDTAPVQTVTNTSWFGTRVLWVPALGKFISVVNTEVTNHFNLDTRNYAAAMTDGVEAASVTKYFLYQIRTVTYAP